MEVKVILVDKQPQVLVLLHINKNTMNWEVITVIYKTVEYSVTSLNVLMGILSIFLFTKLPSNYQLLCVNFMIASLIELITIGVNYFHLYEIPHLESLEHLLIISEAILVGLFFSKIAENVTLRNAIIFLIFVVILFELYMIVAYPIDKNTEYGSIILSSSMCMCGLITLFEISKKNLNQNFNKQPDTIIVGGLIAIYTILIILFFLYQPILQFPSLATFFIIFKNLCLFIALVVIAKGMLLKVKKTKPASFPKPSPPLPKLN